MDELQTAWIEYILFFLYLFFFSLPFRLANLAKVLEALFFFSSIPENPEMAARSTCSDPGPADRQVVPCQYKCLRRCVWLIASEGF